MPLSAILFAGLLLSYRLIFDGYIYAEDADTHLLWAQQFLKSFKSGILHPSWVGDSNAGYGSPSFIFYPPFIFYTYALIGFIVREVPTVINISAIIGMLASGLSMYALCRLFLGKPASVFSAILYMALPYHLIDIYHRSAVAEFWAFFWFPLVIYFLFREKGLKTPFKGSVPLLGLSVSYCGLIITHLPTALIFSLLIPPFLIFLYFPGKNLKALSLKAMALFVGIALSSFYLVPAVFEQKYVNIDFLTYEGSHLDFRRNFLFSDLSMLPIHYSNMAVASLSIMVFFLGIYFFNRKHLRGDGGSATFFAFMGIASVLMMTGASLPLWEALKVVGLDKIQFPIRFMTVACLFAALCAGASAEMLFGMKDRRAKITLAAVFSAVIALNAAHSIKVIGDFTGFESSGFTIRADMTYSELKAEMGKFRANRHAIDPLEDTFEYRPVRSVRDGQLAIPMPPPDSVRAIFFKGGGDIEVFWWEPEYRILLVRSGDGGTLLLRAYYYEGWRAYIDGNPIEMGFEPSSGLITVPVSSGKHQIILRFEGTRYRKAGNIVSLAAIAFLLALMTMPRLTKTKPDSDKICH